MVYITKSTLVAALLVAPSLAVPFSQPEQEFTGREFDETDLDARARKINLKGAVKGIKAVGRFAGKALNHAGNLAMIGSMFSGRDFEFEDFDEISARDLDAVLELEARANGRGFALGGAAFAAMIAARPLGESIATIFKRPKNPTFKRGLEDEYEVYGRQLEEELEMLEREYEEAVEARSPGVQAKTLLKIGTILGKHARWVIPAAGAAGVGIGMAGKLRSRDFGEEVDIYERYHDMGGSLDEMD